MPPHAPATQPRSLHRILMLTSRVGMGALVYLCAIEVVAYLPWLGNRDVPAIELISAGPMAYVWPLLWGVAGIWCLVTLVRGRGAGALLVAILCALWAFGFWVSFLSTVFGPKPLSQEYLGASLYTVYAVLLFTGRYLARGLLTLTGPTA